MTSTTRFPETTGTAPFTYPPVPAMDEAAAGPDAQTIHPQEPEPYSGASAVPAADEKTRTPLLPAAIWGIAAAGIALGCRYRSDMVGDALITGAERAADALTEIGLFGSVSLQAAFLQAGIGILLLILLWVCGMCAVGQPGVFALILVRGIGTGCTAASVWEAGEWGQEQLLTLIPQALTLTLLVCGACCAVRMGNSIFSQLTTGKRAEGSMSALSYTLRMGLIGIGVLAVWMSAYFIPSFSLAS